MRQAQTFSPSVGNFRFCFSLLCDAASACVFAFLRPLWWLLHYSSGWWDFSNKNPGGGPNEMAQFQLSHTLSYLLWVCRDKSHIWSLQEKWVIKSYSKVSIHADSLTTAINNARAKKKRLHVFIRVIFAVMSSVGKVSSSGACKVQFKINGEKHLFAGNFSDEFDWSRKKYKH